MSVGNLAKMCNILRKEYVEAIFRLKLNLINITSLFKKILTDSESNVYHYPFGQADYFSITSEIEGRPWLVLISAKGFMETAFPPDNMQDYIVQSKYVFLGKLKELIP